MKHTQKKLSYEKKMQQVLLCSEPVASDKQAVQKFHKSLVNPGSLHNFLNNKISRPHFYRFLFLRSDMGPLVSWSCLVKSHESQLLGFKESCETHIGSLNWPLWKYLPQKSENATNVQRICTIKKLYRQLISS